MKRKRKIDVGESSKRKENRGKKTKVKSDEDQEWSERSEVSGNRNRNNSCILHNASLVKVGDFVSFESCYDGAGTKLEYLQNIKKRRLKEDTNSSQRMKTVCDLIPNSLDGLDLETTGWHRKCYQTFTKNLDWFKEPDDATMMPP